MFLYCRTPVRHFLEHIMLKIIKYSILISIIIAGVGCGEKSKQSDNTALALLLLGSNTDQSSSNDETQNCPEDGHLPEGVYLADTIISAPAREDAQFRDPDLAVNGICGNETGKGSIDVFSLDQTGEGASLVISWSGYSVVNGEGLDFIVFENSFHIDGTDNNYFMEAAIVEVSNDGEKWCGFGPDYTYSDETSYSNQIDSWKDFAGIHPVKYNQLTSDLTAAEIFEDSDTDGTPDNAGGDGFDLEDLVGDNFYDTGCDDSLASELKENGFTQLRITAATARTNPDTGNAFLFDDGAINGPDIDGVLARSVTSTEL